MRAGAASDVRDAHRQIRGSGRIGGFGESTAMTIVRRAALLLVMWAEASSIWGSVSPIGRATRLRSSAARA